LLTCGDIESNPGPPRQQNPKHNTRQSSIYFTHQQERRLSQDTDPRAPKSPQNTTSSESHDEMFEFLRNMKKDLAGQNERVVKDLASMNTKIDSLADSINDLKTENELLKQSNSELKTEVTTLASKIDTLEAHSRRNNLRFNGIDGTSNEEWSVTEQKVRTFIENELKMPEMKDVEIERAHRLRYGGTDDKRTIMVKFTKYKDCMSIFQKGNEALGRNSTYAVQQDFTERVKRHRKELGEEMLEARKRGQYASVRYDKLFIDNKIYKYDDDSKSIVYIGNRNRRPPPPRVITNTDDESSLDAAGAEGGATGGATGGDINNDDLDSSDSDTNESG